MSPSVTPTTLPAKRSWMVEVEHLPVSLRTESVLMTPPDDRRRRVADDLYDALVKQGAPFLEHFYPMFWRGTSPCMYLVRARSSRSSDRVPGALTHHLTTLRHLPDGASLSVRYISSTYS